MVKGGIVYVLLLPPLSSFMEPIVGEASSSMSEDKSQNDGTEHGGQLVAGSGTAEGYSREGLDVDGRLNHTADPTRGAKVSFRFGGGCC